MPLVLAGEELAILQVDQRDVFVISVKVGNRF